MEVRPCPKPSLPSTLSFRSTSNSGGNNGISGAQDLPDVAVLPDGRFVVTYQSDYFGSATDTDPIVAIFEVNGATSLAYRDTYNAGALQKTPVATARLDGGFGVAFQNERHANNTVDANGPNITYVPLSAAGGVLSPIAVADFNAGAGHDALQNPAIATLSTGRQVVAFERVWTALTDDDVFLNVVNEAGTATQFSIANPLDVSSNASWQANPSVAAIGNQAIVVSRTGPAPRPRAPTSGDASSTAPRTRSALLSPSPITPRGCAPPTWLRSTTIATRSPTAIRMTFGRGSTTRHRRHFRPRFRSMSQAASHLIRRFPSCPRVASL